MLYYIAYKGSYLRSGRLDITTLITTALTIPQSEIEKFESAFAVWGLTDFIKFVSQEEAEFYSVDDVPEKCIPNPEDSHTDWFKRNYKKTADEALKAYHENRIRDAKTSFSEAKAVMRELGLPVYEIKHNTKRKA